MATGGRCPERIVLRIEDDKTTARPNLGGEGRLEPEGVGCDLKAEGPQHLDECIVRALNSA